MLAHRLILESLNAQADPPRVPVPFSLGTWDPHRTDLHSWLADRLIGDYAFLDEETAEGTTLARLLLEAGRILPVLDGFEGIRQQHREAAISEISRFDGPLILTTRPAEFITAVHAGRTLSKAAVIELEDLTFDRVQSYLQAVTSKARAAQWESTFAYMRANPGDPACRNLAAVLATPLLVMLARTVYHDTPHNNPTDLIDGDRFPTQAALEEHLFGAYLATLYDPRRKTGTGPWTEQQARRWLGHLADHLTRLNTQDLTWWHLGATLPRLTRILVTGLVGLPLGAIAGVLGYVIADYLSGTTIDRGQLGQGLLEMGTGLVAGLVSGLVNEMRTARGRAPERLRLRTTRWPGSIPARALHGLGTELAVGLSVGILFSVASWLVYGFAFDFSHPSAALFVQAFVPSLTTLLGGTGVPVYLAAGLLLGLLVGISYALVNLIVCLFSGPTDQSSAVSTWELLHTDRAVTLFRAGMVGFVVWLVNLILVGSQYGELLGGAFIRQGVLYGTLYGSFAALTRLFLSAWGGWLIFARLWLPLTGRLPWRPRRFLDDAYERGVLRQTGAVYQFRHASFRDHLVGHHRAGRPPKDL
ncbi:hypothetical protein [Sinosporangium siamense]|uniref:hypothetical protein n=1 Tax=Sinosporangium siamense TaxID=1367973 RepID=UPI00195051DE|nr:hypothetical protein [Sinosporangium siamense]